MAALADLEKKDYVEGDVLVIIKKSGEQNVKLSEMPREQALDEIGEKSAAIAQITNAKVVATFNTLSIATDKIVLRLHSDEKTTEELIALLRDAPAVINATPNRIHRFSEIDSKAKSKSVAAVTPNDPYYGQLWGLTAINAPSAWEKTVGKDNVYAVVLDTGIDYENEDLAGNMGNFVGTHAGYGVIRMLDVYEYSYREGKFKLISTNIQGIGGGTAGGKLNLSTWGDFNGHGTHVAGTIGAVGNNSKGVTGINWNVKLLGIGNAAALIVNDALQGLMSNYFTDANIINAAEYIVEQKKAGVNIRIVNMSFGGWRTPPKAPENDPYYAALKLLSDSGIILAIASGNDYQDIDNPKGSGSNPNNPQRDYRGERPYPACHKLANSITVGAVGKDKSWSDFANYSPNYVDIAAPGEKILSTYTKYKITAEETLHYKTITPPYYESSGTSMATPHVAGAAALLCAAFPDKTAGEIKALLLNNANKNFAKTGKSAHGLLDLGAAMKAGDTPPPTPTPSGGGGGGGGCNGGVQFAALLSVVALAYFSKRK